MRDQPERTPEREAYYKKIHSQNLRPLWDVLKNIQTVEPKPREMPTLWKYDRDVKPALLESGSVISAREADRRVLVLENPGLRDYFFPCITHSLFAGLQMIMPGEVAPSHRHTQGALRFIIEGEGAYTAVNGEKTMMKVGDFVITPSWTWHDHGNETDQPMVWLDGLDIPIVDLLNCSFFEPYAEDQFPIDRPDGDSTARWGYAMVPDGYEHRTPTSPILNYSYERTREVLDKMADRGAHDPCHGFKMRYINPVTGDWAMPTMATSMTLLPKGFSGAPFRATDGAVYVVVEGHGRTVIDGKAYEWGPRDVFVAPTWCWQQHETNGSEAVIFSYSDRPVQEKLGLYREQRGRGA
ncbi:MAG: gentisate 1,2-dioxygenase [Candidatus Binataceae bacterium]|nr:gentisate 1,2-dioxygenase [Candidatus Binataceae bacterium]